MFYDKSLQNIVRMLKPNGLFLFTCATKGRPEHGTIRTGTYSSPLTCQKEEWKDYYMNIEWDHVTKAIDVDKIFKDYKFKVVNTHHDLQFYGIKK